MRWLAFGPALLAAAFGLGGCVRGQAHEFPARDEAEFHRSCPAADPVCVCIWDEVTHDLTAEEYEAAMQRFRTDGIMDHKITHARTICLERHPHQSAPAN